MANQPCDHARHDTVQQQAEHEQNRPLPRVGNLSDGLVVRDGLCVHGGNAEFIGQPAEPAYQFGEHVRVEQGALPVEGVLADGEHQRDTGEQAGERGEPELVRHFAPVPAHIWLMQVRFVHVHRRLRQGVFAADEGERVEPCALLARALAFTHE